MVRGRCNKHLPNLWQYVVIFCISFSQEAWMCGKVTWLPNLFSFIYFIGWAGPFFLILFLFSLFEKNLKKLAPDGNFFVLHGYQSLGFCECDGLMNCLMHPWVLFLNWDVGRNLLSAGSPRNSSAEQRWAWCSALCWACRVGPGRDGEGWQSPTSLQGRWRCGQAS